MEKHPTCCKKWYNLSHYIRSTVIDSLPHCSSSSVHLFYIVFLSADSEDEKLAKKSKKSPKEKQKTSKLEPAPKKDPVQYVSETGDWTTV